MRRLVLAVVLGLAALFVPSVPMAAADTVGDEWAFLQRINRDRQAAGLQPVAMSIQLREVARGHSAAMAGADAIWHRNPLDAGVPDTWQRLGENVGRGGGVDSLHAAFMNSPGHRANLLNGLFNYVGLGVVHAGGVLYVTELFMQAPPGVATDSPPVCGALQPTPGPEATFHPLAPTRIVDTRTGLGGSGRIGGAAALTPKVLGVAGVPTAGVTGVLLNVTATEPAGAGYVTVHPCGAATPLASNLNFRGGDTVANLVTAKVNETGRVRIVSPNTSTHVVVDLVGFYADTTVPAGSTLQPLTPARVLDTRTGIGGPAGAVGPGGTRAVEILGQGGVPTSGVSAVVLNLTATEPTVSSFVTAWPAGMARPTASNLNVTAGATVANLVTVKVGDGGRIGLYNNHGTTHLVADVVGWFASPDAVATATTGAGRFHGLDPRRILDTRSSIGRIGQGATVDLDVTGVGGVPADGVRAVVMNVTVTEPTGPSYLTAFPAGVVRPTASNLNYLAGQTIPNLVVVKVGDNGRVSLYNNVGGAHVVVDVVGWYS